MMNKKAAFLTECSAILFETHMKNCMEIEEEKIIKIEKIENKEKRKPNVKTKKI